MTMSTLVHRKTLVTLVHSVTISTFVHSVIDLVHTCVHGLTLSTFVHSMTLSTLVHSVTLSTLVHSVTCPHLPIVRNFSTHTHTVNSKVKGRLYQLPKNTGKVLVTTPAGHPLDLLGVQILVFLKFISS